MKHVPRGVQKRASRSGISIMELLAAVSLIGAITLFVLPVFSSIRNADAASTRRAFALREASNLVERLKSQADPVAPMPDEALSDKLPGAIIEVVDETPVPNDSGVAMTQRTLVLAWDEASGRRSIRLSWWSIAPREAAR